MNQKTKDTMAYNLAYDFLIKNAKSKGVTKDIIDEYLHLSETTKRPESIKGIYSHILSSAQNANMKPNVIGKAIGGFDNLGKVLFNFDHLKVMKKYGSDSESLLNDIEIKLLPHKKIRKEKKSIWPKYCKTILSAAIFMDKFSSADDFYKWADSFDSDVRKRSALPMIISYEIEGIGFPLACDFLMGLGYHNFGKPDVHIKQIFKALELCPKGAKDYHVFQSIIRIASNVGKAPNNVDKLFWLIGSGYFYNHKATIGKKGKIGRMKMEFISYADSKLS